MRNVVAPAALIIMIGSKLFSVGIKAFKSATVVKAGLGAASLVSYAWLFSWEFAFVIIVSLIVHELGHVLAMRTVGIPTKGFYLIPFVGGAAVPERAFHSRHEEHFVALAGPLFGLAQAVLCYGIFLATDHALAGAVAAWVALFNLLNLLPIPPLDGGRIIKSISFSINSALGSGFMILGIVACCALLILLESWILALILVAGFFDLFAEKYGRRFRNMDPMSIHQTVRSFAAYSVTCIAFVSIIWACGSVPEAAIIQDLIKD